MQSVLIRSTPHSLSRSSQTPLVTFTSQLHIFFPMPTESNHCCLYVPATGAWATNLPGKHSHCEFMSAMALSCQKPTCHRSPPQARLLPFSEMVPEPWERTVTEMMVLCSPNSGFSLVTVTICFFLLPLLCSDRAWLRFGKQVFGQKK